MNDTITILIAEDNALVREAWSFMLSCNPRFRVVAETIVGEETVERTRQVKPDVLILDINMQDLSGMAVASEIRDLAPSVKILGVSVHTRPAYVRRMMEAGFAGCISRNSGSKEMFRAIEEIAAGRKYLCPMIQNSITESMIVVRKNKGVNALSPRELEIISHIKNGDSSRIIARKLNIAQKTIEAHRYNLMRKLGLKNVVSLVNYINNYQLELDERYAI